MRKIQRLTNIISRGTGISITIPAIHLTRLYCYQDSYLPLALLDNIECCSQSFWILIINPTDHYGLAEALNMSICCDLLRVYLNICVKSVKRDRGKNIFISLNVNYRLDCVVHFLVLSENWRVGLQRWISSQLQTVFCHSVMTQQKLAVLRKRFILFFF